MTLPECTKCEDPHRSRKTSEWNGVDFDECATFSALAADEQRDRSGEARYALLAANRRKTNTTAALRTSRMSLPIVRWKAGTVPPFGCRWCGLELGSHGQLWLPMHKGLHSWERPTDRQILARMRARRTHRPSTPVRTSTPGLSVSWSSKHNSYCIEHTTSRLIVAKGWTRRGDAVAVAATLDGIVPWAATAAKLREAPFSKVADVSDRVKAGGGAFVSRLATQNGAAE